MRSYRDLAQAQKSFGVKRRDEPKSGRRGSARRFVAACLGLVAADLVGSTVSRAADDPVFSIEFHDGKVTPLRIEVPAKRRFKLELHNSGTTPAEFESNELHKEKVLAPDTVSVLVFHTLDPGEYAFFDDFHPDAPKAVLVAK